MFKKIIENNKINSYKRNKLRNVQEQIKVKKRIVRSFIFFLILIIGLIVNQQYRKNNLSKNGTKTKAVVIGINHETYVVEDGTPRINHYYISYSFKTLNKEIKSVFEVSNYHYNEYFKRKIQINDSINIIYLESNPKRNEILKLE